jgi:hypothetical protein
MHTIASSARIFVGICAITESRPGPYDLRFLASREDCAVAATRDSNRSKRHRLGRITKLTSRSGLMANISIRSRLINSAFRSWGIAMKAKALTAASRTIVFALFCLIINSFPQACAQTCQPTATPKNDKCSGDGSISTSVHVTNPCDCGVTVDVTDAKNHGAWNFGVGPGAEIDQRLWPCGMNHEEASLSLSYKFKCGNGDKNGQNTESPALRGGNVTDDESRGGTNKNVQDLISKYCRPETETSLCLSECMKNKDKYPSGAFCVNICADSDAACAAARRGDAEAAARQDTTARLMGETGVFIKKKTDDAARAALARKTQQLSEERRRKELREAQQKAAKRAAQAPVRPSQTFTQPVQVDDGYPPGCRNRNGYRQCALGGACSFYSIPACRNICWTECNID